MLSGTTLQRRMRLPCGDSQPVSGSFILRIFSQPSTDRIVYPLIRKHAPRRIFEFGLGLVERAERMIEVAASTATAAEISYTGIDQFEGRAGGSRGRLLKAAHRRLASSGARVRLLPGDAYSALLRTPNKPGTADLVVIAAEHSPTALARAWYLIERLAHEGTLVLWQEPKPAGVGPFRQVSRDEWPQPGRIPPSIAGRLSPAVAAFWGAGRFPASSRHPGEPRRPGAALWVCVAWTG